MAAFADLNELVDRASGNNDGNPESIGWFKGFRSEGAAVSAFVASTPVSLWRFDGDPPAGAVPTSAAIPTRATTGALGQANAGGGRTKRLLSAAAGASNIGGLILLDRLAHMGGLAGDTTAPQTVDLTIDRYTGDESHGNLAFFEIYDALGTPQVTFTIDYTDGAGASQTSNTSANFIGGTAFSSVHQFVPIALADGATPGVRAVASITLSTATSAEGDFGITIARPLLFVPQAVTGAGSLRDLVAGCPRAIEIKPDACLFWVWTSATAAGSVQALGQVLMVER